MPERMRWAKGAGPGRWPLLLLVLLAVALGGCLDDAADKNFDFDNPNDPGSTTPSDILIAFADFGSHVVTVVNSTGQNTDITGWLIELERTADQFTFPDFTLSSGAFVRIHLEITGPSDFVDLYPDTGLTFTFISTDRILLKNTDGTTVDSCGDGDPCWG